jgi:mycoredoxin
VVGQGQIGSVDIEFAELIFLVSKENSVMVLEDIKMYGTTWCPDCVRSKRWLEKHGFSYTWYDIGKDAAARDYVVKVNHGNRSVPTILFPDGSVLVEPSDAELAKKLHPHE